MYVCMSDCADSAVVASPFARCRRTRWERHPSCRTRTPQRRNFSSDFCGHHCNCSTRVGRRYGVVMCNGAWPLNPKIKYVITHAILSVISEPSSTVVYPLASNLLVPPQGPLTENFPSACMHIAISNFSFHQTAVRMIESERSTARAGKEIDEK